MFTSTIRTPDESKILKGFNSLVTAAKLPKQRFLDLQHACVSLLGAQGVALKVIAENCRTSGALRTSTSRFTRNRNGKPLARWMSF